MRCECRWFSEARNSKWYFQLSDTGNAAECEASIPHQAFYFAAQFVYPHERNGASPGERCHSGGVHPYRCRICELLELPGAEVGPSVHIFVQIGLAAGIKCRRFLPPLEQKTF